jgi:hypothetical protein
VVLDGTTLPTPTPARVQVKRDLAVHSLDLRKDGFLPVSHAIRYDRAVDLTFTAQLDPGPPAASPTPKP